MTRLWTCGYETGDVAEAGVTIIGASATLTVVNTVPTPRAGSFCLKVATTSGTFSRTTKTFALPAAKTDVWVRFAFFAHTASPAVAMPFAALDDAAGIIQTSLTYTASDGLVRLYRGTVNTLLATAGTAFPPDTWHVLEWRTQITNATTGISELWLDGNQVINFSGDNVQSSTQFNVQALELGAIDPGGVSGIGIGSYYAYDDIAINDTVGTVNNGRAGDGRVVLLSPTGAGSSTVLTRGGTDTGANWSQVSELPPSILQYVSSATVGDRDLYAMADLGVAVQSINVVEAIALAQNSDAGGGSIAPTVKSGATTNEASPIGLSTSPGYVTARWETDPNTTAAWTQAAVNALEAGATVR